MSIEKMSAERPCILENAHVVTTNPKTGTGIEYNGYVILENGIIIATGEGQPTYMDGWMVRDMQGQIVAPGSWDIHTHGAGENGCFWDGNEDHAKEAAQRKAEEGITRLFPSSMTQIFEAIKTAASIFATIAKDKNLPRMDLWKMEGPYLNKDAIGAQNPDFARLPSIDEVLELNAIHRIGTLALAPELEGALDVIRKAVDNGIVVSAAHTMATGPELRDGINAGLSHMTHYLNAMTLKEKRKDLGCEGEAQLHDQVMLEVIGDNIHMGEDDLRYLLTLFLHRIMLITDSVTGSHMPADEQEFDLTGKKYTVAKTESGLLTTRLVDGGHLAGSVATYPQIVNRARKAINGKLVNIIPGTGFNQSRQFGILDEAVIERNAKADLTVWSPEVDNQDIEVRETIVGGNTIYPSA